jgi:hypothetical protein
VKNAVGRNGSERLQDAELPQSSIYKNKNKTEYL